jgi:hypothetical protein
VIGYFVYSLSSSKPNDQKSVGYGGGYSQEGYEGDLPITDPQAQLSGWVVYTFKQNGNTDILKISPDGVKKKLFTDSDEELKIKAATSLNRDGTKVLLLMGQKDSDTGMKLLTVTTDGKAEKETLIDPFTSFGAPFLSPDNDYISYLLFSNADQDYGYKLYLSKTDGANKVKLAENKDYLSSGVFSPDEKQIAFAQSKSKDEWIINIVDISGKNLKELITLKQQPEKLFFGRDFILFSLLKEKEATANAREIGIVNISKPKIKFLTDDQLAQKDPYVSPDNNFIAYLQVDYPQKEADPNLLGEIIIIDLKGKEIKKLSQANQIIGWIP